jgi:hypothetical protein
LPVNRAALDWARDRVAAADPATLSPRAVHFLLREYLTNGSDTVRTAVEYGLTRGLARGSSDPDVPDRLAWLRVLADALVMTEDERIREAIDRALPSAIDALEALVRRAYEPGEGLVERSCADHLRLAAALLTAFDLSGRLPYGMLAEELLQHARRHWWRDTHGSFDTTFAANCAALHVCCRLAALHADAEYRSAAVVAPASTYPADARRLAEWIGRRSADHPQHAGDVGAALLDWFALESNLQ